jgi:geranylgeranyl diphosphate synthase type II
MNILKPLVQLFENHLKGHPLSKEPINLYGPADYILSLGGKRIRPVFALLGCDLYQNDPKKALGVAMSVEVFHNFTLLHDDIMDQADIRRGHPTVHIKYDLNTAILTGDVMMLQAYQYLLDYEDPVLIKELLTVSNKMAFQVCEGQQLDMDFETQDNVTIDEYLKMVTLKTSVLLAASIQMGGIIGGASKEDQNHLYQFAKNFGIAFQLQDDILDTFGDAAEVGKKIGGDIIRNKKTYLYIKALELSSENQKQTLINLFEPSNKMDELIKITQVTEIFNSLLVKEYANQLIEAYRDLSISHLNACQIDSKRKEEITALVNQLIFRKN